MAAADPRVRLARRGERDAAQVEALKPRRHPLDVPQVRVVRGPAGLIGPAEADQAGRERTVAASASSGIILRYK
jgi:hypothetical protein